MTLSAREQAKKRVLEEIEQRDLAKQIILQIIKQAGGTLAKTKLFKAFWLAHLFFAKNSPGYLSGWKIVRIPHGPGIDQGDDLILQLKRSGDINLAHEPKGPYTETVCKIAREDQQQTHLPVGAIEAIENAVQIVNTNDSAIQPSQWSHEFSRSWNTTPNGKELDIYSDLVPDDIYYERKHKLEELNEVYDDLFK